MRYIVVRDYYVAEFDIELVAGRDVYDGDLEQQVRAFQRDNRLDVDGLAGQQTQIIINSLLGSEDTPRLKTSRLARE